MTAKKETYEEAMRRLEDIVKKVESGDLDIDSLADHLKEAQKLIQLCRDKLYKADAEIKKMLEETE